MDQQFRSIDHAFQGRIRYRAKDRLAVHDNKHSAVRGPNDFRRRMLESLRSLTRRRLHKAEGGDQVIQRDGACAGRDDFAHEGEGVAPSVRGVRETAFRDFETIQRDEAVGAIHVAVRLEPNDAEQFLFRLSRLNFDRGARDERIAGPAFHLRQVQRDGLPVRRTNTRPRGVLVDGRRRGERVQHEQKCETRQHETQHTRSLWYNSHRDVPLLLNWAFSATPFRSNASVWQPIPAAINARRVLIRVWAFVFILCWEFVFSWLCSRFVRASTECAASVRR